VKNLIQRGPRPFGQQHPWQPEPNDFVELRRRGTLVRTGRVEAIMPDGSGFWLAPHGPDQRRYVHLSDEEDLEIWA
jgi:hypothetical protein